MLLACWRADSEAGPVGITLVGRAGALAGLSEPQCFPDYALNKRRFRGRIRLSVKSVHLGKPALQSGIFQSHVGVGSKVIAKRQLLDPERASKRNQMQVVRALRW
jgi:hypothetical protein